MINAVKIKSLAYSIFLAMNFLNILFNVTFVTIIFFIFLVINPIFNHNISFIVFYYILIFNIF